MSARDTSFPSGDIVEESQWMEIGTSCDSFSIGLKHIFLLFEQSEIAANAIKDLVLLELRLLAAAVALH
jgi:hypothetical protein